MGIFDKLTEPVFYESNNSLEKQLQNMRVLREELNEAGRKLIDQDMKFIEYGLAGEKNLEYELKNSHMPMYVIHDLYLEHEGLTAQIDYIVITRKLNFIIECKNLFGNIEINSRGDFIRSLNINGHIRKEGIYSPVTQNQRHMELLKKIRINEKSNVIIKFFADRYYMDFNKPLVVLVNPKTILNDKYAKKEIKNQVIRADQLITYITNEVSKSKEIASSDSEMKELADRFIDFRTDNELDYLSKYDSYKIKRIDSEVLAQTDETNTCYAKKKVEESTIPKEQKTKAILVCPACGAYLTKKKGKYGWFYGCAAYPTCTYTEQIHRK